MVFQRYEPNGSKTFFKGIGMDKFFLKKVFTGQILIFSVHILTALIYAYRNFNVTTANTTDKTVTTQKRTAILLS